MLIEAFRDNADYEFMAEHLFPGGSLGNGAAMRSAPIGLRFAGDRERIWEEARQSAWPTHRHELGIEAHESVVTALACFALIPKNFREAIATAIWQGGDTDTIAAMTGALVGAHIGSEFAESLPLGQLEEGAEFIAYLRSVSEQLSAAAGL